MSRRILIIEDDPSLGRMLALHFEDQGFAVTAAADCATGLGLYRDPGADVVLLDQQLPDGEGIELLPQLLAVRPGGTVVMMTGQHDLELAIRAIKAGAADFVHKPVKTATLQATIDRALAAHAVEPVPATGPQAGDLIGRSDAMLEVSKQIALCAGNTATVLISGESGTGKEVVARLIHQHGGSSGPFVAVNCAAIVENLLESELFGHEKGAFTGADRGKPGRFELAADGTLFLDEVAELAPPLQAKLLRALQERTFERVGGTATLPLRARLVAATHRDLFALVREGRFREDLAYRLNVVNISLPPLRDRPEDIPLLAVALLDRNARQHGQEPRGLSADAIERLCTHPWPGNVRELENVLTQALVLARGGPVTADHVRFRDAGTAPATAAAGDDALPASLEAVEAAHIQRVLDYTGGHKGRACDILGISRPALDRKIGKYGLRVPGRG